MTVFLGLNIVFNPLARDIRTTWKVQPNPIKKRRRGWRVVKHVIDKPGCYQMGNTLVMHPDFKAALAAAAIGEQL